VAKIINLRQELEVRLNKALSVEARKRLAAQAAERILEQTLAHNRQILKRDVGYEQYVDGKKGIPLTSVNPDNGNISFIFDLVFPMLAWIDEQLVLNSPWGDDPIHYARSHILLADGVEIDPSEGIPPAQEYFFVNTVPYARKIERGESSQAPDGVYEVVADQARRRFGNLAIVRFTYRSILGPYVRLGGKSGGKAASPELRAAHKAETETRNPAILVLPR
jgi:hypothetical protein